MFCKNCGSQLPDGMNFCQFCGTPQQSNAPAEYETYAAPQKPDAPVEYETYAAPPVMPPVPPVMPSEPPVAPPPPVNPINPGEPDKPKKNNTGNIIIAVVAVVLIVAVAVVAIILFGNKDKDQGDTTTTTSTTQAEITIPANNTLPDANTSGTETTDSSTEQSSSLPITLPSISIPSFAPSMPSIQIPTMPQTQTPTVPQTQRPTTPPTQAPTTPPTQRPTTPPTQAPTTPPTQPPTQPSVSRPSLSSAESVAKSYAKDTVLLDFASLIDKEILGTSKISPEIDKYVVNVTGESSASKAYAVVSDMFGTKVNNASDFLDIVRLVSGYEDGLKEEYGSDYRVTTTVYDSAYLSASEAAPFVNSAKSQINSVVSSSGINWNAIEDYAAVGVLVKVSGSKAQDELYMTVILAYINGSWKVLCFTDGNENMLFGPMVIESFTEV